jgi:hypothetical protein
MDADSDQQDQNARKIFRTVTIPASVTCELFSKLKYKNVIKMKNTVTLICPYYELHFDQMK